MRYVPCILVLLAGLGCGSAGDRNGNDATSQAASAAQQAKISSVVPAAAPALSAARQSSALTSTRIPPDRSRVPVGELVIGTWLPAGLDSYRFGAEDQALLAGLGLNQIEWLQRAESAGETAEARAMAFCRVRGLQMPVFYEPQGYTPYDKLQNWAKRSPVEEGFAAAVTERVQALKKQWAGEKGLQGYLVGHEDYDADYYEALAGVVAAIAKVDSLRPALTVGRIDHYEDGEVFCDAFFQEGGQPHIFQHEHYIFRGNVPTAGSGLQSKLSFLLKGYDQVAGHLQGRWGRWHAIVQVQSETRGEKVYYRKPSPAEISVQAGLALSRGAAGIVYFLYSSGVEEFRNNKGEWVQTRYYEGLVDRDGAPTASYGAVQAINRKLQALSPVLAGLYFYGAAEAQNEFLSGADADLAFGLFGDETRRTHLLVVNRRTWQGRTVALAAKGVGLSDAVTGEDLPIVDGKTRVALAAGGFRLLSVGEGAGGGGR